MGRRAPRRIATAIEVARGRAAPATVLGAVQQVWLEVVGAEIASAAEPVGERDGTVVVRCQAAVWAQELDLMQERIVSRLRQQLGSAAPRRLRFEVGTARDPR